VRKTFWRALALWVAIVPFVLPAAARAQDANVTVLHGISGGALGLAANLPVDVWANGEPLITDFTFGEVVGPVALPPGTYELRVYLAGSNPDTTAPVLSLDAVIPAGADVHVVAHFTPGPGIALTPFVNNATPQIDDAVSPRISERSVRLTVRHGADFPRVAINRLVDAFEPTLANGDTLSVDLNPGTYRFWLSQAGAPRPVSSQPVAVTLQGGTHYYVYAVGSPLDGSFQLKIVTAPLP
jgi:hypothetical protein